MTDVIVALRQIFLADLNISALIAGGIYNEDLPKSENTNMPRKNIVIKSAGGIEEIKTDTLFMQRFDVWCYGESIYEARKLDRAVYDCVKTIERKTIINILIHSAGLSGGSIKITDPDTGWIARVRSVYLIADDRDID